jgi:hypothetical protein
MKYLFVLTALACLALPTFSQTPSNSSAKSVCSLTRDQSPEIRGIRLGMSTEQLKNLFPQEETRRRIVDAVNAAKQDENYGAGRLDLPLDRTDSRWKGVNYLSLRLVDERVTGISISYVGPEWKTVDQFVAKLSEGFRLPGSAWEISRGTSALLNCDGFRVQAHAASGSTESSVHVVDLKAPEVVEERREAAKEKVRQAFRP